MSDAVRGGGWRGIALASGGNFLEMYDFMVFGFYAAPLSRGMFPGRGGFVALMLALSTFGAGFLMRPIGAVVLGAFLDRHGRRKGLLLTLSLMAFGTLTIAAMPPYARIGMAAPIMILIGRLVQGLSAGVEVGGVSMYLSEISPPGRRGFYVAWQSGSQQLAVVFAAVLGLALSLSLSRSAMLDWGWRIPFLVGCMLIPFLFLARRRMVETPAFLARRSRPDGRQILRALGRAWPLVALGTMLTTMTTVSFYMITVFTPTFGTTILHLSPAVSLTVTMCIGLSNFILLPVMGALSDRVGRAPMLRGAALASLLSSYPALVWLVDRPSFARLLVVGLWLSAVYAAYNGALIAFLTEAMPATAGTSAFALAYSLATAIFGGFTPAVCTFLIHQTGNRAMPGLWLSGAALVAFLSATLAGRVVGRCGSAAGEGSAAMAR
jgi:MFS transporter, MHS family, citrate/tricarballylate:H+ symporter